jgi:excisionase family DNA binding protein
MANALITTTEAAARVGMPRRSFLRAVEDGRVTPAQKLDGIRGAYLFEAETIDTFAAERAS